MNIEITGANFTGNYSAFNLLKAVLMLVDLFLLTIIRYDQSAKLTWAVPADPICDRISDTQWL
jgi:hypothetical protein